MWGCLFSSLPVNLHSYESIQITWQHIFPPPPPPHSVFSSSTILTGLLFFVLFCFFQCAANYFNRKLQLNQLSLAYDKSHVPGLDTLRMNFKPVHLGSKTNMLSQPKKIALFDKLTLKEPCSRYLHSVPEN